MKARTYKKLLRLNQDEWERLRYLSKSTGLNQEQVLRKVLMDAPLLERPTADYIKMSRQIAALGNNLNQLAHIANASGKVSNTDLLTAKQTFGPSYRHSSLLRFPMYKVYHLETAEHPMQWTGLKPPSPL